VSSVDEADRDPRDGLREDLASCRARRGWSAGSARSRAWSIRQLFGVVPKPTPQARRREHCTIGAERVQRAQPPKGMESLIVLRSYAQATVRAARRGHEGLHELARFFAERRRAEQGAFGRALRGEAPERARVGRFDYDVLRPLV
jgi:hypothetical protein